MHKDSLNKALADNNDESICDILNAIKRIPIVDGLLLVESLKVCCAALVLVTVEIKCHLHQLIVRKLSYWRS